MRLNHPTPLTCLLVTRTVNGLPNPNPNPTWGSGNKGLITYTAEGYMSATLATTDPDYLPKNVSIPAQPGQDDTDWALVGKHTLFYAGNFSVNETFPSDKHSGQILHGPIMVASIPSYVGGVMKREYSVIYDKRGKIEWVKFSVRGSGGYRSELLWKKLA